MKQIEFFKKFSTVILPVCMMIAGAFMFVSCSDDDGDGGGSGSGSASGAATTTINGKLLTGVGDYRFVYDDKNRLTRVYDSYEDLMKIDYSSNKLIEDEEEAKLSFTKNGYISKLSASWSEEDEDYSEKGSGTMSFTYDGSGHLTKIKMTSSFSGKEDGEKYSGSGSSEYTITWSDGNMTKVVGKVTEKEDGYKFEETVTSTFSYGSTDNAFQQYTKALAYPFDLSDGLDYAAFVGLLGKSSAKLPSSLKEVYAYEEDGDSGSYTETLNPSYTLNDDGSVKSEYIGYSTINYSYTTAAAGAKALAKSVSGASRQDGKKMSLRSLFKRNRK